MGVKVAASQLAALGGGSSLALRELEGRGAEIDGGRLGAPLAASSFTVTVPASIMSLTLPGEIGNSSRSGDSSLERTTASFRTQSARG
jgi:hypothetical protein